MMRRQEAGFTLVELLAALALTATLAIFVLGGIDFTRRSWFASRAREIPDEIDAAQGRLRELLARTMPTYAIDGTSGLARLAFEGRSDTLTFVTLNEVSGARGGLMRVRLGRTNDERSHDLTLLTGVFRADPARIIENEPVALFRQISDVTIKYFGIAELGEPARWRADWIARDRLPQLVRLEIALSGALDPRHLIVPVALRTAP